MGLWYFGLGSNLGDREAALARAVELLSAEPALKIVAKSCLYDSAPLGPAQPRYLNAAVAVESSLDPIDLLDVAKRTEAKLGRQTAERWGPRVIDVDVLLGDSTVARPDLAIPHPRLHERAFALLPLADVAPDAFHQGLGLTVGALLQALQPQDVSRVPSAGPWDRVAAK